VLVWRVPTLPPVPQGAHMALPGGPLPTRRPSR